MRLRFIGLSLAAIALAPAILSAALCDDTYNLQSVVQTDWQGEDASALSRTVSKTVSPDLSDLQVLDTSVGYAVISRFEGSCAKAAKPITLRWKPSGTRAFKDSIDNGYMVQMFDSNTVLNDQKFDYWFGFFKPAETLRRFLSRTNSQGPAFVGWYVVVYYTDSTKNDTSGIWKVRPGVYFDATGPDDSVALERQILDVTIRKQPKNSDKYRAHYRVQFLKVSYENKPSPIGVMPARRMPIASFQARQTGNLVLIQTGAKTSATEPLALYNMLGNKVASIHPTGFLYQWNGKTTAGAEAPAGVYFVQAGNRVLGKFFFSR